MSAAQPWRLVWVAVCVCSTDAPLPCPGTQAGVEKWGADYCWEREGMEGEFEDPISNSE